MVIEIGYKLVQLWAKCCLKWSVN